MNDLALLIKHLVKDLTSEEAQILSNEIGTASTSPSIIRDMASDLIKKRGAK